MRLDNRVAYATTGIFVIAMLFVGAELLHSANVAIASGDKGLIQLGDILEDGVRHGDGEVLPDRLLRHLLHLPDRRLARREPDVRRLRGTRCRGKGEAKGEEVASGARERSWPFRAYLLWLTFPPIVLLFQGEPFRLIIIYGVLGAAFMPFLAGTLIWLLNSARTPREWRNGPVSNAMLAIAGLLFLVLCVKQIWDQPWAEFF